MIPHVLRSRHRSVNKGTFSSNTYKWSCQRRGSPPVEGTISNVRRFTKVGQNVDLVDVQKHKSSGQQAGDVKKGSSDDAKRFTFQLIVKQSPSLSLEPQTVATLLVSVSTVLAHVFVRAVSISDFNSGRACGHTKPRDRTCAAAAVPRRSQQSIGESRDSASATHNYVYLSSVWQIKKWFGNARFCQRHFAWQIWESQIGTVKGSWPHLSRREQENPKYINIIYDII